MICQAPGTQLTGKLRRCANLDGLPLTIKQVLQCNKSLDLFLKLLTRILHCLCIMFPGSSNAHCQHMFDVVSFCLHLSSQQGLCQSTLHMPATYPTFHDSKVVSCSQLSSTPCFLYGMRHWPARCCIPMLSFMYASHPPNADTDLADFDACMYLSGPSHVHHALSFVSSLWCVRE